jgi:hypothetical protein
VPLDRTRIRARKQHRDGHVHQEEQNQEGFGGRIEVRPVTQHAPDRGDAEGESEADQVEQPPGPEPGDRQDAGIEHGVVAEQRNVTTLAGRGEDRREKSARGAEHCQGQRILQHRQHRRQRRHGEQQSEGRPGRKQPEQPQRTEDGQVEQADATSLQRQRVAFPAEPKAPADEQQRHGGKRHPGQAKFDRDVHVLVGVLEQESDAEEQDHDAGAGHQVAAQQPIPDRRGPALRQCRLLSAQRWSPCGWRGWRGRLLCRGGLGKPGVCRCRLFDGCRQPADRRRGRRWNGLGRGHRHRVVRRGSNRRHRHRCRRLDPVRCRRPLIEAIELGFDPPQAFVDQPETLILDLPRPAAQRPAEYAAEQRTNDPQAGPDLPGEKRPQYCPQEPHLRCPPPMPATRSTLVAKAKSSSETPLIDRPEPMPGGALPASSVLRQRQSCSPDGWRWRTWPARNWPASGTMTPPNQLPESRLARRPSTLVCRQHP